MILEPLVIAPTAISAAKLLINWAYVNSETFKTNDELVDLGAKVTITIPTLNEGEHIAKTLQSIRDQNIVQAYPEMFEVMVVDSLSEDDTVAISTLYADTIMTAQRGLLNARSMAVEGAQGEIIVNCNGDVFYPPNYINTILKPYADENVVGVSGMTVLPGLSGVVAMEVCMAHPKPWLYGSASSFRKWAYDAVGGFNLDFDQHDYLKVIWFEENEFAGRLAQVGEVVWEPRALAWTVVRPLGHSWL